MFQQRTSDQKPGDGLLADFRQQFPQIGSVSAATTAPAMDQTVAMDAPESMIQQPQLESQEQMHNEAFRDQDPTPRGSGEPWRFTPSMFDPNSFNFNNFTNMGYCTPTPGGNNTLFHPQAGDLHTVNMGGGQGLGTPLSMPTSGDSIPSGAGLAPIAGGFHALPPHQLHHFNPFIHVPPPQPSFAPSSFVHQDTGYETMEQDGSPLDSDLSDDHINSIDATFQTISPTNAGSFRHHKLPGTQLGHALPSAAERFRYHSTLNAPTAMIKQADEIPITYLNKGQAYSLSIVDTDTALPLVPGTQYRTFVRVSFEDEEQRQRPGICWALWKEGRGTSESHQRGGKLQAVEFVEAGQPVEGDDKRTRVELESYSFDGFSVVWTPGMNGAPEVSIAVRFNFLSTDFSHSKGVKGIPVRLCSKTSPIAPAPADPTEQPNDNSAEICFCKVKLFRDHGAERKLSNDVAHVKKSMDKLKQQLAQVESGMKDFGKRKRSSVVSKASDAQKSGKVQKHKRTWSMSSTSSAGGGGGGRRTVEEDLHFKLQTLQDMFSSTRPVSVLYLRGKDTDDPDAHPVSMPGDLSPRSQGEVVREGPNWQARSQHGSSITTGSMISPSPSSLSLASQASAVGTGAQWQKYDATTTTSNIHGQGPETMTKVPTTDDEGNLSGWIEALDVDHSYKPPREKARKPVACFYIQHLQQMGPPAKPTYHRAIYLTERTVREFNARIAAKWNLEPSQILRTVHVIQNNLEVEVDDDVVMELKEGQDMTLDLQEITDSPTPVKREWEMAVDTNEKDAAELVSPPLSQPPKTGLVLRLTF